MSTSGARGRAPAYGCRRNPRRIGPTVSCRRTQLRLCNALTFSNLDDEDCDSQPHQNENDVSAGELPDIECKLRPDEDEQSRQRVACPPEETLDSRLGFIFCGAARV